MHQLALHSHKCSILGSCCILNILFLISGGYTKEAGEEEEVISWQGLEYKGRLEGTGCSSCAMFNYAK
jgi:hypothetical protein